MIKALIFDLDGTLIDRQRVFTEMLNRELHLLFKDENLIQEMIKDILDYDQYGSVPRKIAFTKWADKYNIPSNIPKELDEKWKKESGNIVYLYPDVKDTLKKLKEKYSIGILSNGNSSSQRKKLNNINIEGLYDYSLISSEYEVSKPNKDIFDYTCRQMGYKNDECAYIGDSYSIDVLGSKNAGLKPIYISRRKERHDECLTIFEIEDLLTIF